MIAKFDSKGLRQMMNTFWRSLGCREDFVDSLFFYSGGDETSRM